MINSLSFSIEINHKYKNNMIMRLNTIETPVIDLKGRFFPLTTDEHEVLS